MFGAQGAQRPVAAPQRRHEPDTPRVQHTIGGISDALRGSRRAQFFTELLRPQQGQELDDGSTCGGVGRHPPHHDHRRGPAPPARS